MKTAKDLKIGDSIECLVFNPSTSKQEWIHSKITRTTDDSIWCNNTGTKFIRRTTVDQGHFYRIKK